MDFAACHHALAEPIFHHIGETVVTGQFHGPSADQHANCQIARHGGGMGGSKPKTENLNHAILHFHSSTAQMSQSLLLFIGA